MVFNSKNTWKTTKLHWKLRSLYLPFSNSMTKKKNTILEWKGEKYLMKKVIIKYGLNRIKCRNANNWHYNNETLFEKNSNVKYIWSAHQLTFSIEYAARHIKGQTSSGIMLDSFSFLIISIVGSPEKAKK